MKVESEKVGLKLNILKTKIMASGPTTSWEMMGKQWKQCQTLFLEPPKIKSPTVYIVSPSIRHEVIGLDAIIFVF